jgi:hypothetical protein
MVNILLKLIQHDIAIIINIIHHSTHVIASTYGISTKHSTQVTINVEPPEVRTEMGGTMKYHLYHIHGMDTLGPIDVFRRYSDFIVLKRSLGSRWPGMYVPALPEKKFIGKSESDFVDIRKQGL